MRETLGLVGDIDVETIIDELEAAFALRFADDELSEWRTIGDIEDCVLARLRKACGEGRKCATMMAFHRLRSALTTSRLRSAARPDAAMTSFTQATPRALRRALGERGLVLPGFPGVWTGVAFLLGCAAIGAIAASVILNSWAFAPLVLAFGVASRIAARADPGAFPAALKLGELADRVALRNFGRLAREGARVDRRSVSAAVRFVLSDAADCPIDEMGRSTRLIA